MDEIRDTELCMDFELLTVASVPVPCGSGYIGIGVKPPIFSENLLTGSWCSFCHVHFTPKNPDTGESTYFYFKYHGHSNVMDNPPAIFPAENVNV